MLLQLEVVVHGHVVDELHVLGVEIVIEAGDGDVRLGVGAAAFIVAALEHAYR